MDFDTAPPSNVIQFPSFEVCTAEEETDSCSRPWGMIEVLHMERGKALIEGCIPTKVLPGILLLLNSGAHIEVDETGKLIVRYVER